MTERRDVWIPGVVAVWGERAGDEFRTVKDAAEADRALNDPGNTNWCPLCQEYFGNRAFRAHAPECIRLRAGRWEGQREREPGYSKRHRPRLFTGG